MSDKVCDECGGRHYAKGKCVKCYTRSRKAIKSGTGARETSASAETGISRVSPAGLELSAEKTCAAWTCGEPVYGLGVCRAHYEEWGMESIALGGPLHEAKRAKSRKNKADTV